MTQIHTDYRAEQGEEEERKNFKPQNTQALRAARSTLKEREKRRGLPQMNRMNTDGRK